MRTRTSRIDRLYAMALFVFAAFAMASCDSGSIVQEKFTVPNGEWDMKKVFVTKVDVTDTINPYNFYLNVRNGGEYPYSNLHVYVTTIFPNGRRSIDSVECTLADKSGRWKGSGLGDMLDSRIQHDIWFKANKKFPMKGTYKFALQHAMRDTVIPAILNVGISIEQAN